VRAVDAVRQPGCSDGCATLQPQMPRFASM
jgi:hypothetical protein